jgi:hypothetical protein
MSHKAHKRVFSDRDPLFYELLTQPFLICRDRAEIEDFCGPSRALNSSPALRKSRRYRIHCD